MRRAQLCARVFVRELLWRKQDELELAGHGVPQGVLARAVAAHRIHHLDFADVLLLDAARLVGLQRDER
jgi:hypothetical protein